MSPSKFLNSDVRKEVINGPRTPIRISKDSHGIHKPPPNPSSHKYITEAAAAAKSPSQSTAKRPPVIIYTHSPKVIHANARDFMALVQKLTGLTRDEAGVNTPVNSEEEIVKEEDSSSDEKDCGGVVNNSNFVGYVENSDTTSFVTEDHLFMGDFKPEFMSNVKQESPAVSPMYNLSSSYLVEPPHFMANSSEFFCPVMPSSLYQPPSMASSSMSPAFLDYMSSFPDY